MAGECILPTHPRTGLRALGFTSRGPVWPVMGGDESDDAAAQAAAAADAAKAAAAWKAPESQADLDRIIQQRLARETAKYADYEAIKEKAGQFDALSAASRTDTENAVAAAKAEAEANALATAIPRVVRAEFKAAAKDAGLDKDQLAALLEDLDLTKYVDKDGEVDEEKVAKKVGAFAPAKNGTTHRPLSLGQGNRSSVQAKPGDGARAALAARGIKVE